MIEKNPGFTVLIPARGGSKGIPKKNITLLNNKPLISYTIEAAVKCSYINECYVSTDCPQIAKVSCQYGASVIDRPSEISGDYATTEEVIKHTIESLNIAGSNQYLVLLQATSPLRTSVHLKDCIEQFLKSNCKTAVSVCKAEHHPYLFREIINGRLEPLEKDKIKPRQLLPDFYRINGAIYIFSINDYLTSKKIYIEPIMPYIMDQSESIDIDTPVDLMLSELLLNKNQHASYIELDELIKC